MPSHGFVVLVTLATGAALAGCSSSGTLSRYTHDSPEAARQAAGTAQQAGTYQADPHQDGTYLDGTGPTAGAAEREELRRQARGAAPVAAQAVRSDSLSSRTTGSRPQGAAERLKPYSEEWWDKEKREDARLKQKMNICRGC